MALVILVGCRGDAPGPSTRQRTIEARLTADVVHSAWPGEPLPGHPRRSTAARSRRATRDWIAAVASALEVSADVETLRRAVATLEESPPGDDPARRLTALAAVEHALAQASGEPAPLLDAYEHAAAAVAAGGGVAALFDQALAAEDLGLCRVAEAIWHRYLELDRVSDWASEARRRVAALSCRVETEAEGADALFVAATEELLPAWLAARAADPERAAEVLARLAAIGERLATESAEHGVRALTVELRALRDDDHAEALAAYARGRAAFDGLRFDAARPELRRALPLLAEHGSELAPWCRLWLAGIDIYAGRFDPAIRELDAVLAAAPANRPYLAGRLEWAVALAAMRQGSYASAHDRFSAAESAFERGSFADALAVVRAIRSETLTRLGLAADAWRLRMDALRTLQRGRAAAYLHNGLIEGAAAASELGKYRISDAFFTEAADLSRERHDAATALEVALWQADSSTKRRNTRGKARYRVILDAVEAGALPESAASRLAAAATVGLALSADRSAAAEGNALPAAQRYFDSHGPEWMQLRASKAVAAVMRRAGNDAGAAEALGAAIDRIHRIQKRIGGEYADRYVDARQEIFDESIGLALDAGDSLGALSRLEDSRGTQRRTRSAAALLALRRSNDVREEDPVVVVYAHVDDRLIWWRIDGRDVASGAVPSATVLPAVASLVETLSAGKAPPDEAVWATLYESLLAAPLDGLGDDRPLVLVPDGPLQRLPFAALRKRGSGVRLIEQRAISFRVSLEHALEPMDLMDSLSPRDRAEWRATIVGDPAFDATRLSQLPPLPHAAAEAEAVAAAYDPSRTTLLLGATATPRAVRSALSDSDVIHLAAHSFPGPEPSRDAFVLASSDEGSGLVGTADLLPARLSVRLAVLSACSTLGREPTRTGGLLGLARGFAARGVPAVVGTLWPIQDISLEDLMVNFHHDVRSGLSASEALRRAQVLRLTTQGSRAGALDWAAVALVGELPHTPGHTGEGGNDGL